MKKIARFSGGWLKPSKGLVSRMKQLRGGGENQEDEDILIKCNIV